MTLFGNKDVAFRYLSNALGQTHDLTAFLTLNLKICSCVVSTYQLSIANAIVCGSMHAAVPAKTYKSSEWWERRLHCAGRKRNKFKKKKNNI